MAWNEPGGGKDKDPWGNRNKQEGPPDLDELVRKMQDKFGGIFGGRKGGGGGRLGGGGAAGFGIGLIVAIVLIVWVASGIYIIDESERGVVLRFGNFSEVTDPGPHWHVPYPVETVEKVNVTKIFNVTHQAQMLTKDQNLIEIELGAQYRIRDAKEYLFNVREPDYTLKEATESALRQVVGGKTMDEILNPGGRQAVVQDTEDVIQEIVDNYKAGILVTKVNMQSTQPPDAVQDAFQDAIKAEEDEVRLKNQAEAYARDIVPRAEGAAQRILEEAEAYKVQITDKAKGETSRFVQIYNEYLTAPAVTRQRMYLDAMESVLSSVSKVVVKVEQGNSVMFLPLDRYLSGMGSKGSSQGKSTGSGSSGSSTGSGSDANKFNVSDQFRMREGR